MAAGDIAARAIGEVRELHAFFVAWFTGAAGADFQRCEAVLGPDFRMVTPDGRMHDRAAVLDRIRAARGSTASDFAIEILQPSIAWQSDNAVLLEFIEQQYRDGRSFSRCSAALFTDQPGAPNGVAWRHLQETWIQQG
jgi:hypothetical protein